MKKIILTSLICMVPTTAMASYTPITNFDKDYKTVQVVDKIGVHSKISMEGEAQADNLLVYKKNYVGYGVQWALSDKWALQYAYTPLLRAHTVIDLNEQHNDYGSEEDEEEFRNYSNRVSDDSGENNVALNTENNANSNAKKRSRRSVENAEDNPKYGFRNLEVTHNNKKPVFYEYHKGDSNLNYLEGTYIFNGEKYYYYDKRFQKNPKESMDTYEIMPIVPINQDETEYIIKKNGEIVKGEYYSSSNFDCRNFIVGEDGKGKYFGPHTGTCFMHGPDVGGFGGGGGNSSSDLGSVRTGGTTTVKPNPDPPQPTPQPDPPQPTPQPTPNPGNEDINNARIYTFDLRFDLHQIHAVYKEHDKLNYYFGADGIKYKSKETISITENGHTMTDGATEKKWLWGVSGGIISHRQVDEKTTLFTQLGIGTAVKYEAKFGFIHKLGKDFDLGVHYDWAKYKLPGNKFGMKNLYQRGLNINLTYKF